MSSGRFDYQQYVINDIADSIENAKVGVKIRRKYWKFSKKVLRS